MCYMGTLVQVQENCSYEKTHSVIQNKWIFCIKNGSCQNLVLASRNIDIQKQKQFH